MPQASSDQSRLSFARTSRVFIWLGVMVFLTVLIGLFSTARTESTPVRKSLVPLTWNIGYWHWRARWHEGTPVSDANTDLLYVEVGFPPPVGVVAHRRWPVRATWPRNLPQAMAYLVLLRWEGATVPSVESAARIVETYRAVKEQAGAAGQRVTGFQLDFDCPVARLEEYARFLHHLRDALPAEDWLSITALLDWFRPGTRVADVLQRVDEYVPQFYDVGAAAGAEGTEIAMPIEPAKWAPIFNAYGRPYRIGISVFGRIGSIQEGVRDPSTGPSQRKRYFRELRPLDILNRRELRPAGESRSQAGETILRFNVDREAAAQSCCFLAGERIEVVLPTADSVLKAYRAAQAFGGFCTGVVFFRWPADNDAMILRPAEVRQALATGTLVTGPCTLEAVDGLCSAVSCVDLYLRLGDRFPTRPISIRLLAGANLEYFLPAEHVRARVTGRRRIEVRLPAYVSLPRLRLGRAVTRQPAPFHLEAP